MKKEMFSEYKKRLNDVTDSLDLKHAISSDRKGTRKFRDYFVFMKMALTESLSYFAVIQAVLLVVALTPQAIGNMNGVFVFLHLPFTLDVTFSSVITAIAIFLIFTFGVIAYRFFGLARSANEIACRYNPGQLLIFKELQEIKDEIEKFKNEKP